MYDEALAEFALATDGETMTHADYALRAGIYFDKGDFDNANTDYTEAIRLRKEFQDFYLNKDYSRRRTEAITKIASNRAKASQNDAINRLLAIKKELEQPTGNAKK